MARQEISTLEILRTVAVEFNDVPSDKVLTFIEIVKPLISEKRFGENYQIALAYLAAHKMKMAGLGVTSYSEGEVSASYAVAQNVNSSKDAEYALTVYGLQFLSIRRLCIIPIRSAGERR